MSLDPDAELVLGMIRASGRPPVQALSPQQAREAYRASRKAVTPEPPDVAQVDDLAAPGPGGTMALRMYRGLGSSGALPVLVFFHGGGFCIGDLDTHDYVCRKIANNAGCAVISVDYRLAPEHRFPRRWRTVRLRSIGWASRRSCSGSIGGASRWEATAQAAICP